MPPNPHAQGRDAAGPENSRKENRAGDAHSDGHKPTDGSVQPRHGGPSRVRHRPALSPAAAGPAPLPPGSLHPAAQLRGPELHRTARSGPGSATAADIAKSPARSAEPPRPTRTAPPCKPPQLQRSPFFGSGGGGFWNQFAFSSPSHPSVLTEQT